MITIKFEDYKEKITQELKNRLEKSPIPGEQSGFILVDGFVLQSLSSEVSSSIVLGGQTLPLVAIVGNTSGRVYYFAFKVLFPDLGN